MSPSLRRAREKRKRPAIASRFELDLKFDVALESGAFGTARVFVFACPRRVWRASRDEDAAFGEGFLVGLFQLWLTSFQ